MIKYILNLNLNKIYGSDFLIRKRQKETRRTVKNEEKYEQ